MCFFIQETEAEEEVLPCDKEISVLIYSTPDRKQKVFIYKKKKNTWMRSKWLIDRLPDLSMQTLQQS
jgi:lipocalin